MSTKSIKTPELIAMVLAKSNIFVPFAPKPEDIQKFNYSINIQHNIMPGEHSRGLAFSARIYSKNYPDILIGDFTIIYNFKVIVPNSELPEEIKQTMNSIAYSTSRGIIFMQTNGTPLQLALLPVVSPNNLK